MKIAVVGKGGSGKSTVSWLLTQYLAAKKQQVRAIDGDHNMDLMNILVGSDFTSEFFYKSRAPVRDLFGVNDDQRWRSIVESTITPKEEDIKKIYDEYSQTINEHLKLMVLGLGDDIMYLDKCSHGLSAVIKYSLPSYQPADEHVVMDSVAGVDMVNYGLYCGFDLVCVVVEQAMNSMKVGGHVQKLLQKQGVRTCLVVNKYDDQLGDVQVDTIGDVPMFKIPKNINILSYNSELALQQTGPHLDNIFDFAQSQEPLSIETTKRLLKDLEDIKLHQKQA